MPENTILLVKVTPGANQFEITRFNEWTGEFEVRVKSSPTKGKANQELIEELEKVFNAKVRIVSGETSRRKRIEVVGKTMDEINLSLKAFKSRNP